MPQTIDLINFPFGEDVSQWPKLTCTQPGHLDLQDAGLRLPASRDIFFQDNGQIRSGDDTHRLVFDRAGGLLELHEAGAIRWLTGSPTPTERLRILATGEVGIGTATPTSLLHVVGDMRTDGALRVAGQAVVGGPLTVSSRVGIGTATPTQTLEVVGTVKATAFQGDGAGLTGLSGTDNTKVAKTGDTMTGALTLTAAGTALSVTNNAVVDGTLTVGSNVGIGTTAPTQKLEVVGTVQATAFQGSGAALTGVRDSTKVAKTGDTMTGALSITAAGTALSVIGGAVGIGTANPAFQLSLGSSIARTKLALYETSASNAYGLGVVAGQFRLHLGNNQARFAFFDSAAENAKEIVTIGGSGNLVVTGTARKPGGGAWADLSDRLLKTNIQQLKGALDTLLRLRGVCFEWLEPAKQGNLTGPQIGMIAQEVETVLPDWVSTTPEGYKLLAIRGFEALTVEAFRELQAQHDALAARVKQLEAQVRA